MAEDKEENGARGGSRTHMRKNPRRILSPQRLPFRHPGDWQYKSNQRTGLLQPERQPDSKPPPAGGTERICTAKIRSFGKSMVSGMSCRCRGCFDRVIARNF